jgi:hypothetical protein
MNTPSKLVRPRSSLRRLLRWLIFTGGGVAAGIAAVHFGFSFCALTNLFC